MKQVFFFLFLLFTGAATNAQQKGVTSASAKVDPLSFPETSFDFGRIPQGKPVTHNFVVVNNSKEPVSIENIQAACGCTTPEWSRDPIAPGAGATIKVGYNSAAEGAFEKGITVYYKNGQMKTIMIRGHVWKTPDQSAPANKSVAILKNLN